MMVNWFAVAVIALFISKLHNEQIKLKPCK